MFFKKEKEVVELILKHVEKVDACLGTSLETLETYLNGDVKEAKVMGRKVREFESEADLVRYDIRNKLYSGAYLPLIRGDIYKAVEGLDRVANAGEGAYKFFLNQRPSIPDELKSQFVAVTRGSFGVIGELKQAMLCFFEAKSDMDELREHTKKIGIQESTVDKMEWDLTKAIFVSEMDFSHRLHLKLCLNKIVEVSDRAEDAADQLELAALKSVV